MRVRLNKWLRFMRGKAKGYNMSPADGARGSVTLGIQASSGEDDKSLSSSVTLDQQKSMAHVNGVTNPSSRPVTGSSLGRKDGHRLSVVTSAQTLQHPDVAFQATSPPPSSTPPADMVVPNASSVYERPPGVIRNHVPDPSAPTHQPLKGSDTMASPSRHYAMYSDSEESLASVSMTSSASSESAASEMEQDGLRSETTAVLDPMSMMPPNIDHMLVYLMPGRPLPFRPGPVSRNANDLFAFSSTDMDLGSFFEAWTRGLQTHVESSA